MTFSRIDRGKALRWSAFLSSQSSTRERRVVCWRTNVCSAALSSSAALALEVRAAAEVTGAFDYLGVAPGARLVFEKAVNAAADAA